jgi:hypothetical protein
MQCCTNTGDIISALRRCLYRLVSNKAHCPEPCASRVCHSHCKTAIAAWTEQFIATVLLLPQAEIVQVLAEVGEQPAGRWAANMESEATHLSQVCHVLHFHSVEA